MLASLAALALLSTPVAEPGLAVGDSFAAFEPFHVSGPYAGGTMCPVCEYMNLPMVYVWTDPTDAAIPATAATLQAAVTKFGPKAMKTFVLDLNRAGKDKDSVAALTTLSKSESFKATPQVWLLSRPKKLQAVVKDHALAPWDKYRSLTYLVRNRKVVAKFVDLTKSDEDQARLANAIADLMDAG
ncbi:MAG: hypothetical protein JNJ45_12385 [Chthonomonas sp.]|nr:hypothetical protein [Chthonomonas sp.]